MIDIKIIAIKDLLPIQAVRAVAGLNPRTLDIRGQQFLQATEVEINGIISPEFMIISDSQIFAQVPTGQKNSIINTVAVLAQQPSPTRSSVFYFEVGSSLSSLRGIERLVQMFVKICLQTPGTDKFRPTIGGGLLALAGQNVSNDAQNTVSASAVTAINRTRDQIVALQNKAPRIPPDERLLTADVVGVGFDPNTTTLALKVAISAQSGQQAVANLSF